MKFLRDQNANLEKIHLTLNEDLIARTGSNKK